MVEREYYTSVFKKPDLLIIVVLLIIFAMGITMLFQSYMLIHMQMTYMSAGVWLDTDGNPHLGNPEEYNNQSMEIMIDDIIPLSDPV